VLNSVALVHVIESLDKIFLREDRTMAVKASEVNVEDALNHCTVLWKPDLNRIGCEYRASVKTCGAVSAHGDQYPLSRIPGERCLADIAIAAGGQTARAHSEIFRLDWRRGKFEIIDDSSMNAEILSERLRGRGSAMTTVDAKEQTWVLDMSFSLGSWPLISWLAEGGRGGTGGGIGGGPA
jgi:hypothetical protein